MDNKNLRVLEITVISGEDLHVNRKKPVKKNAFVIVKTDPQGTQTTKMDQDGGSYPEWNEKFLIDMYMPMHERYFTAEVRCKTSTGGNRIIGTAKIPASDFLGGIVPENYLHFLSYRLWDSNGERNGIINISVRVQSSPENVGYGSGASCSKQPWSGIASSVKVSNSGTAIGIPIVNLS